MRTFACVIDSGVRLWTLEVDEKNDIYRFISHPSRPWDSGWFTSPLRRDIVRWVHEGKILEDPPDYLLVQEGL